MEWPAANFGGKWHKKDVWGVGDIEVFDGEPGVGYVQVCARSGFSAHVKKAYEQPHFQDLLDAGNRFYIIDWRKPKHRWEYRVHYWDKNTTKEEIEL